MIPCALVACVLFFAACGGETPEPVATVEVINTAAEFSTFWGRAEGQPFARQLELWAEIVETPHQAIYDRLVWRKTGNPAWKVNRTKHLTEYFARYETRAAEIETQFRAFEDTLKAQIAKYKTHFPDARFRLPVYALPTMGQLNGGAADLDGKNVLAFGIDTIVVRGDAVDIIYAHELFHVYHIDRIGTEDWGTKARMSVPLWLEGLATHVSEVLCPGRTEAEYYNSDELPLIEESERAALATAFLKDVERLAWAPSGGGSYGLWFLPYVGEDGKNLGRPERAGYYLGRHAVRRLAQDHELIDMAGWQLPRIHKEMLAALRTFAAAD